jgi:AraC-like DNA-binding protein
VQAETRSSLIPFQDAFTLQKSSHTVVDRMHQLHQFLLIRCVLAAQLSITPNYISQVINEQAECNFFDFINRYRIAEAQSQLASQAGQVNILAIVLDTGFNSKSAFYSDIPDRPPANTENRPRIKLSQNKRLINQSF